MVKRVTAIDLKNDLKKAKEFFNDIKQQPELYQRDLDKLQSMIAEIKQKKSTAKSLNGGESSQIGTQIKQFERLVANELVESVNIKLVQERENLSESEKESLPETLLHVNLFDDDFDLESACMKAAEDVEKKLPRSNEGLSATLKKFISNVKEILKNFISSIRQLFTKDAPIELRGEEVHSQIMKEEKEDLGAHHVSKVHQEYSPMHYSKGNDKISESGAVMGHKERFDEYKSKVQGGGADQSDKHEISQGSKHSTRFPEDDTKIKGPK